MEKEERHGGVGGGYAGRQREAPDKKSSGNNSREVEYKHTEVYKIYI